MRDVLIKSGENGYQKTALISQIKGNPSRIEIFGPEGDALITMDITASNPTGTGRTIKKDMHLRWDLTESEYKRKFIKLLGVPEESEIVKKAAKEKQNHIDRNLICVRYGKEGTARVEFIDRDGQITGPKIHIRRCQAGGFDSSNG